jgi:hypothetical protein
MGFSRFLTRLKEWLWPPKSEFVGAAKYSNLEPIDVEQIAARLRLREEAKRLGEGGVPLVGTRIMSGPEQSAINEVELARFDYQNWATRRLAAINGAIASYDIRHEINQALALESYFEAKAANFLTTDSADVKDLMEAMKHRAAELLSFRRDNKLTRLPNYPSKSQAVLYYALLCAIVLVESFLNGTLFQRGLQGGMLAGVLWAFAFALINVATAFLLGKYVFRYSFHWSTQKQVIGWCSGLLAVCSCVTLGLLLGHLRYSLGSQADEPFELALKSFVSSPFSFDSIDALLLFAVTLIFGFIAFFDGFKTDDPFPGYGAIDRNYLEARKNYDEELEGIYDELRSLKEDCIATLNKTVAACQGATAGLSRQIIEKTTASHRLNAALNTAESAAIALVGIFRTENALARGDREVPTYFNENPSLSVLNLPSFSVEGDEKIAEEQQLLVTRLIEQGPAIRKKIEASFNAKYDQLQPLQLQLQTGDVA